MTTLNVGGVMFTLFVLALIVMGVACGLLIGKIQQLRTEVVALKRQVQRLEARVDGIAAPTHSSDGTSVTSVL